MVFGACGAVVNYNLLSRSIVAICRRALRIPCSAYFDDYLAFGKVGNLAPIRDLMLDFLGDLVLGTKFRFEKTEIGRDISYLGLYLSVGSASVKLSLIPSRRNEIAYAIKLVVETGRLSPRDAEQLAGRLGFCTQAWTGRCGRAPLSAIYRRAHAAGNHTSLDKRLRRALVWFLATLKNEENFSRVFHVQNSEERVVASTDATLKKVAFCDETIGVPEGEESGRNHRRFGFGPTTSPDGSEVNITETEAVYRYLLTLRDRRRRAQKRTQNTPKEEGLLFVHLYVDNVCAQGSLIRGHSKSDYCTDMIEAIWDLVLEEKWLVYFDRVPSALNLADWPTRGKEKQVAALGFELEGMLDFRADLGARTQKFLGSM
jgi:hypothetical protein